jgi:hypothetical protein
VRQQPDIKADEFRADKEARTADRGRGAPGGGRTSPQTYTDAELADAIREQWRKYDAAQAAGKPHIALVQINARLVRLETERENREVRRG